MIIFMEHLGPWTPTKVQMKGHILHFSLLQSSYWCMVVVGHSLDCTSMSRMFVSHLYVFSGG